MVTTLLSFVAGLQMDARFKLKNKISVIGSVSDFAYKWGFNVGLTPEDAGRLSLAIDELISDIVLHAYPDQEGDFDITFIRNADFIEIVAHELGEPFDPTRHQYNRENVVKDGNFEGAGFALIKYLVDDFVFINKGRAGKEFRIVKAIDSEHIADVILVKDDAKDSEVIRGYTLAPVTPDDAEDVAKLIYQTYGYTYPKVELYYPKKIKLEMELGDKFGVVTRTAAETIVGYFAVLRTTDSKIGEVGEAVVSLRHRKQGIMKMMLKALIDQARTKGLVGLFGEAVTVHTISQKVNHKFGFISTALLLSKCPVVKFKGLVEDHPQNISVLVEYLPLVKSDDSKRYFPKEYRRILLEIYAKLGISVFAGRASSPQYHHSSELELKLHYRLKYALLIVRQYGMDFIERITRKIDVLRIKKLRVVYIDLPLHNSATKFIVKDLRKLGFIFSGLMPNFHGEKDYIRMQKLFKTLELSPIQLYTDLANKIKSTIEKDLECISKKQVEI